tara:strand:+ start:5263 stop:5847 length:585 start_codon:yes stop_codon:yes gene_type:complete
MSEKNNDDVSDDSLLDDNVKDLDDENEYSDDRDQLIEKLNLDLSASEEKYLRLAAEMENLRKRTRKDIDNAKRYGLEGILVTLLPLIDSMSLAANHNHDKDSLFEGVEATSKLLNSIIDDAGLKIIDPKDEIFDPLTQEAIQTQKTDLMEPNRVIDVIQVGYSLDGKVLRAAKVIVSSEASNVKDLDTAEKNIT